MLRAAHRQFLAQFLAHPATVGAVAPSSRRLAQRMTEWIDWSNVQGVVEYGPGTGAFTERVLQAKRPDARFFAVELNAEFAEVVRARFAAQRLTVYQRSVEEIDQLCRQQELAEVDAIISGLPWAAFSDELQSRLLDATMRVLRPGGQFATFAYLQGLLLPAGKRFRRKLDQYFSRVERSRPVWRNLPPALVYRCRR